MRHRSLHRIERIETRKEEGFDALYRRYVRMCLDEGIEPLSPDELLGWTVTEERECTTSSVVRFRFSRYSLLEVLPIVALQTTRTMKATTSH